MLPIAVKWRNEVLRMVLSADVCATKKMFKDVWFHYSEFKLDEMHVMKGLEMI